MLKRLGRRFPRITARRFDCPLQVQELRSLLYNDNVSKPTVARAMPANTSNIASRYEEGILVIEILPTRLTDEQQVFALRDEMVSAIRQSASDDIIIDMKNVEYLTSIALLPFVGIRSAAEQRGGRVVLCQPTGIVVDVLSVSQLIVESRECAQHLLMADSLESALALLKS